MPLAAALWGVAALLSIALLGRTGLPVPRRRHRDLCCLPGGQPRHPGIAVGLQLICGRPAATLRLPIGLPWIGANFRMDALAALFLVVVNLGSAGASLFALGYGRHETHLRHACCRSIRLSWPA